MSQEQQNIALLALISLFCIIKAVLIAREGWLGRFLCWANISLGLLIGYAVAWRFYPSLEHELKIVNGLRIQLAVALFCAIIILLGMRIRLWRSRE